MEKLKQKKTKLTKHTKQKIIRRNNANNYPFYKMFSWDLLCFYSIEFLFYTITKGISVSEVLILNAFFILFKILMQVPAVTITDILGHRKSLILGNSLIALYLVVLMLSPNIVVMILAYLIRGLGYDIKVIVETNLLYDSVSTKGGEGLYSKLDSKGASWYFWLDGILCLVAGYLFVINNYLPMFISLGFTVLSIILSFRFKDVKTKEKQGEEEKVKISQSLKEYMADLRNSVGFIVKSNRMKAYIAFGSIFYGIITVFDIYRSELLISKGVPEEQYSMIFAILIILAGVSVTLSRRIHKKFKNKTLTVVSLAYVLSCIVVGIVANITTKNTAIPIIIIMYAIMKMCTSVWYILEYKYLKNFTTEKMRNKISFTYESIVGIVMAIFAIVGSLILKCFSVERTFLLVGLASLAGIILVIDYMKPRFGLRPKEYRKEDINL